jgi:tetrapyrrole methylase family protein/MazG family protein/ATP diphosphatase
MQTSQDIAPSLPIEAQDGQTLPFLVRLMQRLLGPDGCPWDREQDEKSLRRFVLEEACEVIDAIDSQDPAALCDELGDLLLQVVFLAELARNKRQFGPDDVVHAITEKLVRRHPHVFGDVEVSGADDVLKNWDAIKRQEKAARPLLAGVPRSMPALNRAQRLSSKVAQVGFDWPNAAGSREKVAEELTELDEAVKSGDASKMQHELGDVLFALVNLARHIGVDADSALRATCDRFSQRFASVEKRVIENHGGWPTPESNTTLPLAELDQYWDMAKREEV